MVIQETQELNCIVTEISNGVVIAWNDEKHYILDTGVVVFEGNEIKILSSSRR